MISWIRGQNSLPESKTACLRMVLIDIRQRLGVSVANGLVIPIDDVKHHSLIAAVNAFMYEINLHRFKKLDRVLFKPIGSLSGASDLRILYRGGD